MSDASISDTIPADRRTNSATAPRSGIDVGEYMSIGTDEHAINIEPAEDGGAYVDMPGEEAESVPPDADFYANLAEILPDDVKDQIVSDLLERIKDDKESRKERDKQYEEGLRRTGLGNDAPGGASFQGASKVVHPMMTEACVDFAARIMKEMMPPGGPVKASIIGVVTKEKTDRAQRKTDHMNYQITQQIKEARSVLEITMTQVPLGGSQFVHQDWDHRLKRPKWEFRSVDKMYIPFTAADFASAKRRTYHDTITAVEFAQRVKSGMYLDLDLAPPSMRDDPSKSQAANDKIEGKSDTGENKDGDRPIYETMTYLEVTAKMAALLDHEAEDDLCPYVITIDETTRKMLGMYRSWEDGDDAKEPIEFDFEFPFLPWRGALSIGFPQLIGGLSGAATGALRALLDAAHINNTPSGLIKKGSGTSGQTRTPSPGELVEIDTGLETDDIRKAAMPFPFNPPSPVLFELLQFMVTEARGVIRTSLDESQAAGSDTPVPVGTQMSRVEEGMVVFSSIHARQHAALNRLLRGLHRLNRLYLPETLKVDAEGRELLVRRSDYEGPCDIQPVSDPTIYSDQQRWAQLNYIQSRMMVNPAIWNARAVELAGLKLIKWPNPESLLVPAPQPHELNQVNENLAMALGQPVSVFPEQDHLAHLEVLLDFMKSPVLGMNPLLLPIFMPAALKHAAQHIAYLYVERTVQTVTQAAGVPADQLMSNDVGLKRSMDVLLAHASHNVVPALEQNLTATIPVIQQAMAQMKALMPPPPVDPAAAAVQAATAETARKGQADQANNQVEQSKVQLQQEANAIAADRVAAQREATATTAQTKLQTAQMDNETAEQIAETRIASGAKPGYTNGESISKGSGS